MGLDESDEDDSVDEEDDESDLSGLEPEPVSSSRENRPVTRQAPCLVRGDDHLSMLLCDPRFGLVDVVPSLSDGSLSRSPDKE